MILACCCMLATIAQAAQAPGDLLYWEPGARFIEGVRAVIPAKRGFGQQPRTSIELEVDSVHLDLEKLERMIAVTRGAIVLLEREYERGNRGPSRVTTCINSLDSDLKQATALCASAARLGYLKPRELEQMLAAFKLAIDGEKVRLAQFSS